MNYLASSGTFMMYRLCHTLERSDRLSSYKQFVISSVGKPWYQHHQHNRIAMVVVPARKQ